MNNNNIQQLRFPPPRPSRHLLCRRVDLSGKNLKPFGVQLNPSGSSWDLYGKLGTMVNATSILGNVCKTHFSGSAYKSRNNNIFATPILLVRNAMTVESKGWMQQIHFVPGGTVTVVCMHCYDT